jgi:hypothetical protein
LRGLGIRSRLAGTPVRSVPVGWPALDRHAGVREPGRFGRAFACKGLRRTARNHLLDCFEVPSTHRALVLDRFVALLLSTVKFLFTRAGILSYAVKFVAASQLEHSQVQRMETRQRDELESVNPFPFRLNVWFGLSRTFITGIDVWRGMSFSWTAMHLVLNAPPSPPLGGCRKAHQRKGELCDRVSSKPMSGVSG